jgi:CBS domain-containing protein
MLAEDIMTRDVITILPQATVNEVVRRFILNHISGMPVLDRQKKLVGIVTHADVIGRSGDRVEEIMTRHVITATTRIPAEHIAQLIVGNRIKRVPILDKDRVVGIVSRADIIRMMAGHWSCGICGAIHLGTIPAECELCGAPGHLMQRDFFRRAEISSR